MLHVLGERQLQPGQDELDTCQSLLRLWLPRFRRFIEKCWFEPEAQYTDCDEQDIAEKVCSHIRIPGST